MATRMSNDLCSCSETKSLFPPYAKRDLVCVSTLERHSDTDCSASAGVARHSRFCVPQFSPDEACTGIFSSRSRSTYGSSIYSTKSLRVLVSLRERPS